MPDKEKRTFVGFGFGAIQSGLFIFEAARSGKFGRIVVAEVVRDVVDSIRAAQGRFWVNVAREDRIDSVELGPVEMLDPADPRDRERLIEAIAEASEVATAVPSIDFYATETAGSIHRLLARALEKRAEAPSAEPLVVYAAENHNEAAEALEQAVREAHEHEPCARGAAFLNTVIGKMSGVITDPAEIVERGLRPVTAGASRAFLVEEFNRILVTSPRTALGRSVARGIEVFVEKDDLLPFEEAKLYGHNATHALAAYLAALAGIETMDALRDVPGALDFVRAAFLEESGAALISKHAGVDPLFGADGFADYVDDLIRRMFSPFLGDLVERVSRDPTRKLGWHDRLIGTIRLCRAEGVACRRFTRGAAAATLTLRPELAERPDDASPLLKDLWSSSGASPDDSGEIDEICAGVVDALTELTALDSAPPDRLFA